MEKAQTGVDERQLSCRNNLSPRYAFENHQSYPIPSRMYDILQVILETVLGSLPVPAAKAGAVLSWYESHQSTIPISYVTIGIIFLSVVVTALHSSTQITWDTSILAVLLGLWGFTSIYTRRLGRRGAETAIHSTASYSSCAPQSLRALRFNIPRLQTPKDKKSSSNVYQNDTIQMRLPLDVPRCERCDTIKHTTALPPQTYRLYESNDAGSVITPLADDARPCFIKDDDTAATSTASPASRDSAGKMVQFLNDAPDVVDNSQHVATAVQSFPDFVSPSGVTFAFSTTKAATVVEQQSEVKKNSVVAPTSQGWSANLLPHPSADHTLAATAPSTSVATANPDGWDVLGNTIIQTDAVPPLGETAATYHGAASIAAAIESARENQPILPEFDFTFSSLLQSSGSSSPSGPVMRLNDMTRQASNLNVTDKKGYCEQTFDRSDCHVNAEYKDIFFWDPADSECLDTRDLIPRSFFRSEAPVRPCEDVAEASFSSTVSSKPSSPNSLNVFQHPAVPGHLIASPQPNSPPHNNGLPHDFLPSNAYNSLPDQVSAHTEDSHDNPSRQIFDDGAIYAPGEKPEVPLSTVDSCIVSPLPSSPVLPSSTNTPPDGISFEDLSQPDLQVLVELTLNAIQTYVGEHLETRDQQKQLSVGDAWSSCNGLSGEDVPALIDVTITALLSCGSNSTCPGTIQECCLPIGLHHNASSPTQMPVEDHPLWGFLEVVRKNIVTEGDFLHYCWPQVIAAARLPLLLPQTASKLCTFIRSCLHGIRHIGDHYHDSVGHDLPANHHSPLEYQLLEKSAEQSSVKTTLDCFTRALADVRVLLGCVISASGVFSSRDACEIDERFISAMTTVAESLIESYLLLGSFVEASHIFSTVCTRPMLLNSFSLSTVERFIQLSTSDSSGLQFFDLIETYAFCSSPIKQLPSTDELWPIILRYRICLAQNSVSHLGSQVTCCSTSVAAGLPDTRQLNSDVCNDLLNAWIRKERFSAASRLLDQMHQAAILDQQTSLVMLKGYAKMQPPQLDKALACLAHINFENVEPNLLGGPLNSLLTAALAAGKVDIVWKVIDQLTKRQLQVDRENCSLLIKRLRPSSSAYDKKRILALIDSTDIVSDVGYFATVVDACARLKDTRRLRYIVARFVDAKLPPNVHALGTLIKAYGRCQETEKAWALWRSMLADKDLQPTNYTYGCMLDMLVSNGFVEDAIALLREALRMGRGTNTVQYSILIKGCAQQKLLPQALGLYAEMRQRGITCNGVTYNTLINASVAACDIEQAESVARDMLATDSCQPDVITYSTLIKGFCDQGRVDRALQFFQLMDEKKVRADVVVFNTLLEGCSKQMDLALTERIFFTMLDRGIAPSSFTLTILVKFLGKLGQLSRALEFARELPARYQFDCDAYVYTALIAACLTNHDLPTALKFFAEMNSGPLRQAVSARTFGTVVVGCLKASVPLLGYGLVYEAAQRQLFLEKRILVRLCHALKVMPGSAAVLPGAAKVDICGWLSRYSAERSTRPPPPLPRVPSLQLLTVCSQLGLSPNVAETLFSHSFKPGDLQRQSNNASAVNVEKRSNNFVSRKHRRFSKPHRNGMSPLAHWTSTQQPRESHLASASSVHLSDSCSLAFHQKNQRPCPAQRNTGFSISDTCASIARQRSQHALRQAQDASPPTSSQNSTFTPRHPSFGNAVRSTKQIAGSVSSSTQRQTADMM